MKKLHRQEAEHIWLSHKEPLKNSQGNVIGLIGISTDVTELEQAIAIYKVYHIFERQILNSYSQIEFLRHPDQIDTLLVLKE